MFSTSYKFQFLLTLTSHSTPPHRPGLAFLSLNVFRVFFFFFFLDSTMKHFYLTKQHVREDKLLKQNSHFEETSEVQLLLIGRSDGVHTRALCCRCLKLCSMLTCTMSASIFFALLDCSSPSICEIMLQTMFSSVSGCSSDLGYGESLSNCKSVCAFV